MSRKTNSRTDKPLFPLGSLMITANALRTLPQAEVHQALLRHIKGDWGDLDEGDRYSNELALKHKTRLLSAYTTAKGVKFWIITEADRSQTTVLLPEDY